MATSNVSRKRRLVAILAADVCQYSARMEQDETGTLRQLDALKSILDKRIAADNGRIFSRAGDGFLGEFQSPVEAVHAAFKIQNDLSQAKIRDPESLDLRIGVHLADVVIYGDDLLGDGVNIAARIESVSAPGDVTVSQAIFDQVRRAAALEFEPLGLKSLKNISEPMALYRVLLERDQKQLPIWGGRKSKYLMVGSGFLIVFVIGAAGLAKFDVGSSLWGSDAILPRASDINQTLMPTVKSPPFVEAETLTPKAGRVADIPQVKAEPASPKEVDNPLEETVAAKVIRTKPIMLVHEIRPPTGKSCLEVVFGEAVPRLVPVKNAGNRLSDSKLKDLCGISIRLFDNELPFRLQVPPDIELNALGVKTDATASESEKLTGFEVMLKRDQKPLIYKIEVSPLPGANGRKAVYFTHRLVL